MEINTTKEILTVFNREHLIGDQDTSTITNINEYIDSLLNPFSNIVTTQVLQLEELKNSIHLPTSINTNLITELQLNHSKLQNKFTFINVISDITNQCTNYVSSLTASKTIFNNVLNSKASYTSPLTRPTLRTIVASDNSAITKGYVSTLTTNYTLPTPIPNTRLYVNRTGTGFIWA